MRRLQFIAMSAKNDGRRPKLPLVRLRYEPGPDDEHIDLVIEDVHSEKLSWQQYETYIFNRLRANFPHADIQKNVRLVGKRSATRRQIDILVRDRVAGLEITIAFDCKHFNKKINVRHVETFLSTLEDIGVSKGVIITNHGYSRAAVNRAAQGGRDVEVRVVEFQYLSHYHSLGSAIAWSGTFGVRITPPADWVIDNETVAEPNRTLFAMYPLGYTRESAIRHGALIYGNVVHKDDSLQTLEAIVELHNRNIKANALEHGSSAKIEYLDTIARKDMRVLLRRAEIYSGYQGPEYTLYIERSEAVLVLVLLTRPADELGHRRRLELLAQQCEFFHTDEMPSLATLSDPRPPTHASVRLRLKKIAQPTAEGPPAAV